LPCVHGKDERQDGWRSNARGRGASAAGSASLLVRARSPRCRRRASRTGRPWPPRAEPAAGAPARGTWPAKERGMAPAPPPWGGRGESGIGRTVEGTSERAFLEKIWWAQAARRTSTGRAPPRPPYHAGHTHRNRHPGGNVDPRGTFEGSTSGMSNDPVVSGVGTVVGVGHGRGRHATPRGSAAAWTPAGSRDLMAAARSSATAAPTSRATPDRSGKRGESLPIMPTLLDGDRVSEVAGPDARERIVPLGGNVTVADVDREVIWPSNTRWPTPCRNTTCRGAQEHRNVARLGLDDPLERDSG